LGRKSDADLIKLVDLAPRTSELFFENRLPVRQCHVIERGGN
jgi:hypothetical protein